MKTYTWAEKKHRCDELRKLGDAVYENKEKLYQLENEEVGLTRSMFQGAEGFIKSVRSISGKELSLLEGRVPMGRVAVVMPYNFSLGAFFVSGAPAYLAGNGVDVKFSSKCRKTSDFLGKLISEHLSDFTYSYDPQRSFISHHLNNPETKAIQVFGHDSWSEDYRDEVRESGTKWILEGPGKDPFIVFDDTDIKKAARMAVHDFFVNSGQACASSERCYVQESVYDEFLKHLMDEVERVYTDDHDEQSEVLGFLGSETVALRLRHQLKEAQDMGARLLIGGEVREHQVNGSTKYYAQGTVLTDVNHEMEIMREETFAPIIPLQVFSTEEEALQLANDSNYGLTASVFGGSVQFLRKIKRSHGLVFENDTLVNSIMRITLSGQWGGFKQSAWIWEWDGVHFSRREGPRLLLRELSEPQRKFCPKCKRLYNNGYCL